jgi:predicted MPP superfamily phosphohydrolase
VTEKRRGRLRRFLLAAHAVTFVAHGVPALGVAAVAPPSVAAAAGVGMAALTSVRLAATVRTGRRPRWLTRLVDEPLLAHWCASVLATVLLPVVLALALAGRLAAGAALPASRAATGAALATYLFALGAAAWGTWVRRRRVRVAVVDVPIPGLSPAFDGYRIAHLTDIHIGNHDSRERGLEWAALTNRLEPDLVAVTGDLVTAGTDFHEDVAEVLGALRGRDGVFVSMGNHDQWDPELLCRLIEARGPRVLRNEAWIVSRGGATLAVAGIDDRMTGKDDLDRTLAGRTRGVPTVLLSHYPDFFDEAARRGVELTLSGHTHGGQFAVPFASRRWSLSRLLRQHPHGLSIRGRSRLYLSPGLGTTGPPVRVGVAPEIALVVLRAA